VSNSGGDDPPERKVGEGVAGRSVSWLSLRSKYTHSRIVFDIVALAVAVVVELVGGDNACLRAT